MKSLTNFIVVTLIVSLTYTVKYASSLECYECGGFIDIPECGNGYDSSIARYCNAEICSIVKMQVDGEEDISRQCGLTFGSGSMNISANSYGTINTNGIQFSWNTCDTDLCNSGDVQKHQMMALLLSVAFCYYY